MDMTALAIAGVGTAVFLGVLIWKGLWFLRKINEEPEGSLGAHSSRPESIGNSKSGEESKRQSDPRSRV
jgi:hypothetical protein